MLALNLTWPIAQGQVVGWLWTGNAKSDLGQGP